MKQMTFMVAMKDFFGTKPGQTAAQFMLEMKEACGAANDPRRDFYIAGLKANGYDIVSI